MKSESVSCLNRYLSEFPFTATTDVLVGQVGAYGTIDKETGNLLVEGNIYDPEFMRELCKHDVKIHLANFTPQEGPVESDLIIASHGAKRRELNTNHAACVTVFCRRVLAWPVK